jgi:hypothetical protein
MPVTATKPTAATKFETEVQQQLAQVVRRIRTHDLLCGVFLLAVVAFGYLAAMMTLDRWLDIPAWVRQLGFLGLLATLGLIAYRGIVRPFRQAVNPLYAAREVEETVEDAKNSVVNWVDLQDKPMAEGVRAVVAARAAKQFKDADLDKAGESKRLLWLGGALGGLVVVLAALFMTFKPAVFGSLFGRAVNPFSSGAIATRTQIDIVEPKGGDLTVTAGQPVTVTVQVGGKVPDPDAQDRLVVLLRHNQADENFDDVPLEPGTATREWTIRLPERLVQNGFWYKVKGGDAETAEHRVTVRPKPTLTEFEVSYEYPEYLRMKPDTVKSQHLEAHRGTVVTVTAKANRTLKDGRAVLSNNPVPVAGEVVGEQKDSLRVKFPLTESGTYRLLFNSVEGEANTDATVYDIRVLSDQPPTATITNPKDEDITLAMNETLSVDAQVGDDFGIDKVTLRFKLTAPNQPTKPLKGKPYQNGQSFKRAADGTYPTALDYKDSVALPSLTDEAGQPVELKPDAVLEYWLEAVDNCTIPEANVGKSKVQKVRLVPAKVEPQQKDELKKQAEKRKADEAAHQQQQKKKLDQEQRPQKESPQKQNAEPQGEKKEGEKAEGQPGEKQEGQPGAQAEKQPGDAARKDEPKPGEPMPTNDPAAKGADQPDPKQGEKGAQAAADRELQQKAEDINKKLNDLEKQGGEAKANDQPQPGQEAPSGEKKPQPMAGQQPQQGEAKPEPSPMTANEKGGDPQEKPGPLGGAGAQEKPAPQPKDEKKPEGDPKAKPGDQSPMNPGQAGESKQDGQPKEQSGGEGKAEKPTPAGQAKKGPKPDGEKPSGEPKGGAEPKPSGEGASAEKNEGQAQPNDSKQGEAAAKGEPGAKENPWKRGTEKPTPQDANRGERSAGADQKGLEQAAKDLAGNDDQKKQAAREKLDQEIGPDARKKLEKNLDDRKQAADGLNSKDQQQRQQAEDKLNDLQREQMEKDDNAKPRERKAGDAEQLNRQKEIQNAAKDMNSNDPQKREAAEKKLEEMVGKPAVDKAKKLRDDLQSGDKDRQQAAADELKELQKKAKEEQAKQGGEQKPGAGQKDQTTKQEPSKNGENDPTAKPEPGKGGQKGGAAEKEQLAKKPEAEQAMKDLAGNDEKKKAEAREQLDKTVGKDARDQAEKNLDARKDAAEKMRSKDAKQQEQGKAAAEKLQREEIERGTDAKKPNDADRLDRKQIEDALKDLNSDDKDKQQAARDKLDKAAGKDAREKAEQMMKDLQSGDKDRQKAAMDELKKMQDDLKKEADRQAQNDPKPGEKGKDQLSPQDIEKLAKAAQDLNAKDEQKRKEAEKQLDDKLGEQARKELQERLKDGKEPSPEQAEAAKKALEELAKNRPQPAQGANRNDRDPRRDGGIGNTTDTDSKPLDANKEFDKAAGQLQLEQLKKAEANKELLKKLGYTEEEYKRFLDGYEKMVREMPEPKAEKPDAAKANVPAKPTTRVDSSGTVERRDDGSKSTPNSTGTSSAPPGYGDAKKRFFENANKTPKEKDAPK